MCNDHDSQPLRGLPGPPDYCETPSKRKALSTSSNTQDLKKPKTENSVLESMTESQSSQSCQSSQSSQSLIENGESEMETPEAETLTQERYAVYVCPNQLNSLTT